MKTEMENKYLIDTPPPTISGQLHMGHAFSYTQMDFMARYNKMKGKELIYPFCFDNNGIPTEKFAIKQGISLDKITELSEDTSKMYEKLFEDLKMGWSDTRYNTFDPIAQQITMLSFEDLLKKDLIYKGEETYFYCETCKKSIPEAEEHEHEKIEKTGDGWFIKIMDHKEELKKQCEKIDWRPKKFKKRLLNWIDNIDRDWSIARERNYGISIPDSDLKFDTWFISSLTPQITWASYTGDISLDCPTFDIRFQGHDIITTWAFYTIIKSYFHTGQIPWKKLIITGHALDEKGDKISKSDGDFMDPYYFIDKFTSGGIRYWSCQNSIGQDILIDDSIMEQHKKWSIKWINAKKFIEFQKSKGWLGTDDNKMNEWIKIRDMIDYEFEHNSDYPKAFSILNSFFWDRFCSTFIEESKKNSCSDTLEQIYEDMDSYWQIYFP